MGGWSLKRVRWECLSLYRRYGWPLPAAAIGSALAIALVWQGVVRLSESSSIADEAARVTAHSVQRPSANYSDASLPQFYAGLPVESARFSILKSILATAEKHGVLPRSADYKLLREPHTAVVRYQLTMPLVGRWSDMQGFLSAVLAANRSAVVDALQFKRDGVGAQEVTGVLRISLLLARSKDVGSRQVAETER